MYDNIHDTYDTAKYLLSEDNLKVAEEYLKGVLESGHACEQHYAYLAKIFLQINKSELSLKAALKSIKINPKYAYGLARVAYAYLFLEDYENTKKFAQKAYKLCGDNYIIHRILIYVFDAIGMSKERDELFKRIQSLDLDVADYYYTMGCIYWSMEEVEDNREMVKKYFNLALKKGYADNYRINIQLGDLYFSMEDYKNASKYAKKALSLYDGDYDAYILIAKIYGTTERYETVVKTMNNCLGKGFQNAEIYRYLAAAMYNQNKYKKALANLNQALLLENDSYSNYLKSQILSDMGEHGAALEACKKAIEMNSSNSNFYTKCAYLYTNLNDYNKALKYTNIAISLDPDDSYAYYLKGHILSHFGQYNPAIELYQKVIQMDPTDAENFEDICECYSLVENYKKLLEYANTGLMLNKENAALLYYKGQALVMLGEARKAIKCFEKTIEINPEVAGNYTAAAYCYCQLEMWHECLEYSNSALFKDKNSAEACYLKGCALQNLNKPKEAQKMFERADALTSV